MPISLVTGGAGFMGSHVAQHLLDMDHKVIVLDDLSGGFRDNVPSKSSFVEGSILDEKLVNGLFTKHQFQYVFHLAAYGRSESLH